MRKPEDLNSLVRGELLHDKHHHGYFGPLVARETRGSSLGFALQLQAVLPGTSLPWEARGYLPMVTSPSCTGGVFSKLPHPTLRADTSLCPLLKDGVVH